MLCIDPTAPLLVGSLRSVFDEMETSTQNIIQIEFNSLQAASYLACTYFCHRG